MINNEFINYPLINALKKEDNFQCIKLLIDNKIINTEWPNGNNLIKNIIKSRSFTTIKYLQESRSNIFITCSIIGLLPTVSKPFGPA